MKAWFTKLRISLALDAGKDLPIAAEPPGARTQGGRQFARQAQVLDRALKQGRPQVAVPGSLHDSIMQRVQAGEAAVAAVRQPNWWLWMPAPALTVLALLGLWWMLQQGDNSPQLPALAPNSSALNSHRSTLSFSPVPLATAATALQVGEQVNHAVSGTAMVAPLSEELERLNRDLDETTQFLLASLP